MNIGNLTPQQLRSAADLKERIDGLQNELNEVLGGEVSAAVQPAIEAPQRPANGRRKKRKRNISEAGRRAMSLAGKRRWAKARRAGKSRL